MRSSSADLTMSSAEPQPWFSSVARVAFGAKGALHFVLAALALRGDVGAPSSATRALFLALAVGLAISAVYKVVEAFAHPDVRQGTDTLTTRLARLMSAVAYGGLSAIVVRRLATTEPHDPVHWTARILNQPLGPHLVALMGFAILGFGCQQFYRARCGDCARRLGHAQMGPALRRYTGMAAGVAYAGRGVAYSIVGVVVMYAAITFDPRVSPRGVAGTFEALSNTSRGGLALTAIAVGLVAYGAFCSFLLARYHTPCANSATRVG